MDLSTAIIIIVIALIFGIIVGALLTVINIKRLEKKSKKEYNNGKIFKVDGGVDVEIKQKLSQEESILISPEPSQTQSQEPEIKKGWLNKFFKGKNASKK